ncbi:ABC transporter ATP-binding protein, partial [Inquilinus sp.]|uniref:ABC transporter ATP-binding protein n=1 Tax=Inquilinus sp. TaxID=1932117 RepID=UPI0031DE1472
TLLNVLAGFVRPDSGSILVDGVEFLTRPPHKRDLGMVFQNYALFPHMTVFDNVAYPLRLRGVGRGALTGRVRDALATVQMDHLGGRGIHELSGGQKQRVALARAIVFEPRLLLMDEPLSALDKNLREHMQVELKRLHRRLGMTTVYVTHDQREALTMSDRIAVLNRGRLVQLGTPEAIYDRPTDRFVAGFMGDTGFLPVERTADGFRLQGRPLRTAASPPPGAARAWLVVRPERLRWAGSDARDNRIDGTVVDVSYQGDSHLVSVRLPEEGEIAVRHSGGGGVALPRAGDALRLWLDPAATTLVGDAAA